MSLYSINIANEINVTFITYYERFNCNICNNTVGKFICIQNILFTATKGRRKNSSYFYVPSFLFQITTVATLLLADYNVNG